MMPKLSRAEWALLIVFLLILGAALFAISK